jgi:xylulokinase
MYLGIDLGTSGVKALIIDERQAIVGSAHGELDLSRPHPGWSEQDPVHWIRACEEAVAGLKEAHP